MVLSLLTMKTLYSDSAFSLGDAVAPGGGVYVKQIFWFQVVLSVLEEETLHYKATYF